MHFVDFEHLPVEHLPVEHLPFEHLLFLCILCVELKHFPLEHLLFVECDVEFGICRLCICACVCGLPTFVHSPFEQSCVCAFAVVPLGRVLHFTMHMHQAALNAVCMVTRVVILTTLCTCHSLLLSTLALPSL